MGVDVPLRRNRDYMLVWAGQGVSELGSQVSTVAYPLLVLALTGSPAKAGVVGLAATLPLPLLALPAGMLADHFDRKRLMLVCDAVRAAALAALTIAVFSGGVAYGVVAAVAFVDGALLTVSFITERGVLRRLVAPEQLAAAVAQNETAFYASSIVGPPLGGLLFAISRALPFLADAVSYAFSATATLLTRARFQPKRTEPRGSLAAEFTSGLRWLWRQPLLRTCSLLAAAGNPTYRALYLLLVVLAKEHGASSSLIGVMFAMIAAAGALSQSLGWAGPLVIGLALEHFSSTTSILLLCGWALLSALGAALLPSMRSPG
jgi:MFS family permease